MRLSDSIAVAHLQIIDLLYHSQSIRIRVSSVFRSDAQFGPKPFDNLSRTSTSSLLGWGQIRICHAAGQPSSTTARRYPVLFAL